MLHVRADEIGRGEGTTKRQLASQDSGGDDSRQAPFALTGVGCAGRGHGGGRAWRSAVQNRTASECADLQRRHGNEDLERAVETRSYVSQAWRGSVANHLLAHRCDTVGALHNLGGILSSSQEDSSHHVRSVSVKTTDRSSYGRSDQVLRDVKLDHRVNIALQDASNNLGGDDSLRDDALATAIDLLESSRSLVNTVITGH